MGTYTSEVGNVLLYPLHSLALVQQSDIRRDLVPVRQEAIGPNAIVDGDDNNVIAGRINEACSIEIWLAVDSESTSLDEQEDGQLGVLRGVRGRI